MSIIDKLRTCCFIGHRKIKDTSKLRNDLAVVIEKLIVEKKVDTFLFGSKSEFDDLCWEIVTGLKEKYPDIYRIYIRAEFANIDDSYKEYLLKYYDDTYYPEKMINAGKASYVERNHEMIDKSTYCIFYYDENYAPPRRKSNKRDLFDYQPQSGTKIAYDYAEKERKKIINIYTYITNLKDDID